MKWRKWAHKMAFAGHVVLWLNVGVFFILGVLSTLLGGTWTQLGNGPGGGEGIPALIFAIPILLGIPSLILTNRRLVMECIFLSRSGLLVPP